MRIFVTGHDGFLGSNLVRRLASQHDVRGASPPQLRLGEPFDASLFAGIDCVVHCAHDFTPGSAERVIRGTQAIRYAAPDAHHVFVSSWSARPGTRSEYGRTKYVLEQWFLASGDAVLRPGLVVGDGGLYARQIRTLRRLPIVPVLAGATTAAIRLEHFLDAAAVIIEQRLAGAFNLFYAPVSLRDFVRTVRPGAIVATVPTGLARAAAGLVERLHLPLPLSRDQIDAVTAPPPGWTSDLPRLLPGRESEFAL